MIHLSVGVDGITIALPSGECTTVDADQAQNLGNQLLNCAVTARQRQTAPATHTTHRPPWTSEIRP